MCSCRKNITSGRRSTARVAPAIQSRSIQGGQAKVLTATQYKTLERQKAMARQAREKEMQAGVLRKAANDAALARRTSAIKRRSG